MSDAEKPGSDTAGATRPDDKRTIPTGATGAPYSDELSQYLDRLLDEALEETFPASDPIAVPTRREIQTQ